MTDKPKTGRGNKQAYKNSPFVKESENTQGNIKIIQFINELDELNYEPIPSMKEQEDKFAKYKDLCFKYGTKPSNLSAYFAIGIDKDIASDWATKTSSGIPHNNQSANAEDRCRFIKRVKRYCSSYREQHAQVNGGNAAWCIFAAKNFDGMKDTQDIAITQDNPLETPTDEELKRRIMGK